MSDRDSSRRRYSVTEASEILDVSPQTIRNRIKDERLEGFAESDPNSGQVRYFVYADAVESQNEYRKSESEDIVRRYTEQSMRHISRQMDQVSRANQTAFAALLSNQEETIKLLREAVELLKEIAKASNILFVITTLF